MKMPYFVFATALLISLGAGCSPSQPNNTVQPPETNQNAAVQPTPVQTAPVVQPTPATQPAPKPVETKSKIYVTIQNFSFQPSDVSAKKGDSIIFTNQDSVPHTITSQTFDSGQLQKGQSFTLNTSNLSPGTYSFHCSIHPSMTGTITIR
ncbi:MAG: cupredoxin domain-containing protein [Patescibacteria group bacterium]